MQIREQINEAISQVASEIAGEQVTVQVDQADKPEHGDYSSNVALSLGKKLKRNPMEVAEEIARELRIKIQELRVERIDVVSPGFINFTLSKEYLLEHLQKSEATIGSSLQGKRIMVEYAHPNTHKEMHIGHMRTLITGEAIVRLLEASGAKLFRANYQGDIGPHVAKALYGIQKIMGEKDLSIEKIDGWSSKDKAHFLGEGYVRGNVDYDSQKNLIDELNTALYAKDPGVMDLYTKTRQWSLDYYDEFYTRFYTKFDRLFFESEMAEPGKKIVKEHLGKVFKEDNGAIIFPGEQYGLHTRVFVTSSGNPTYEGKEMGNAFAEYEAFPFDLKMHVVASEQAGYFQVVFKALELIDPQKFKGKQHHVSMGMVQLTDASAGSGQSRKMSSRTGDILTVDWLIDQIKERVDNLVKEGRIGRTDNNETMKQSSNDLVEQVAIGAIKYSILKVGTGQNAAFDIEKSVSLDGDSGPYLQYTYARTQSVLAKLKVKSEKLKVDKELEREELLLLRKLALFEDVVLQAAEKYSPNILCGYLFDLAQLFNLFYQKHKIIGSSEEAFRIRLTKRVGAVIKQGLNLLGIKSPEKM